MRRARVITSTLQQTSSLTQLLWPTLIGMLYLLAGYAVWDFWIYRPSPPPPPEPSRSELCMVPVKVMATITAVAHTGGAVSLPVGANTAALRKWSAASSWSGGTKPGAADDVLIPANAIIVLDETVNVRSITVQGRLIMDVTKNINVSANYIHVTGTTAYMEWGTRAQPYLFKGAITLTGSDVNAKIPGTTIPSKAILVGDGATLELNGEVKRSWLSLNANAAVGATQLSLSSATHNWDVGDEIVVTSSRVNWLEAEKRTITAISPDRLTITINSGLTFPHIGRSKSYTRPTDGKVWVGDMRAEIGVLTKSIKIQGDASSTANGFGAHVMIHKDGKAYVNHVEFYLVGQKSVLGSYPFHWHMLLDKGAGQYLKNSSIHSSFNRAVTIHGTESTLTENNFCYDHIGHGIFFEDGSERYNTVRGNVVLVTRRPAVGEELIPSDNEANEVQNRTPSSFWITNPNNTVENNIAAGTQGTGFWFAMPRSPMGFSASEPRFAGMQPYKEPLIRFKGNKAHSCVSGFDIFDQLTAAHGLIKNGGWERTDQRIMDSCTWYACDLAIYGGIGGGRNFTKDVIFRNNIFLDNVTSVMHANYAMIEQSAFVANSGENVFSGERKLNRGYDGSCTIKDCHMIGWQASNANYVQNTGGALKHVNYRITGMTMDHNGPPRMNFPSYAGVPVGDIGANSGAHPRFWSYIHWDMDGSFGGKANTSIITNHQLCRDGSEVRYENWTNLYRTDRRFSYLVVTAPNGEEPKMTLVRTKTGTPKAGQYYINGYHGGSIHFPLMVNDGYLYTMQFETLSPSKSITVRMQDDYVPGDWVMTRIKDFGSLAGINVTSGTGVTRHTSLANLQAATSSGFALDNGFLYLKMVAVASTPDIAFNVTWTGTMTLPLLDTDGDGVSDAQESINGSDPIPNDPITEKPAIPLPCLATITAPVTTACAGTSLTMTASYGMAFQWYKDGALITGATTNEYTATQSGNYTVEITNATGCKKLSAARTITINPLPTATITSPFDAYCPASSVTLTSSAGASYRWFRNGTVISGATAMTYAANTAGNYTVEVTSAAGCKATSAAKTITAGTNPTATITAPSTSFCAGSSLTLTSSAGTSYRWFNNNTLITGATAQTYNATAAGSYTVEVTNAAGCKTTSAATVVTVNALPTATITSPATSFCAGGSVVLTSSAGVSYRWFNNATLITGATAQTYTATDAGSYTVEVTNAAGCKATSAARVITVNALPTATITSANSFCAGGSLVLTSSAGTAYRWFNNNTLITGATAQTFTATAAGSYTVEVTNAAGCKDISTAKVITIDALPTASITGGNSFCAGGSMVLTSSAGASYRWFNSNTLISGATAQTYTVTTAGSYTVEVTNAAGCKATSAAKVITVDALPVVTLSTSANSFCTGFSVTLTSSAGASYRWFNNSVLIVGATSQNYVATSAGSYTVEVTNAAGCKATSAPRVITEDALPAASISSTSTSFCAGSFLPLTASSGGTYRWFYNGNLITGATSQVYNANASGAYTVELTNAAGCKATSAAVVISLDPLPSAVISSASNTFCAGSSLSLTSSAGASYRWFNNGNLIAGATSQTYSATAAGSYTVEVTSAAGCTSTSSAKSILENSLPSASISAASNSFCAGSTLSLNASLGTSYRWFKDGNLLTGATDPSYAAYAAGSYTVEVTNAIGCAALSAPYSITENAVPAASISAASNTFCQGSTLTLQASAGTSYRWMFNSTLISGATSSTYQANAAGDYTVEVTNASGCVSLSPAFTVQVEGISSATISSATTTACDGESIELQTNAGYQYQWKKDGNAIPGASAVSYSATSTGSYTVVLSTPAGCSLEAAARLIQFTAPGTWYLDSDGDGSGDPAQTLVQCTQPSGYVSNAGDQCPSDPAKIQPGVCGCGVDESCITSTQQEQAELGFAVFPNPATEEATIQIEKNADVVQVDVFNTLGELVRSEQFKGASHRLALGEWSSGAYTLRITTAGKVYMKSLVVVK